MADFPTFQDLFRVARDEVLGRNSNLRREIVERAGTDANALTAAGAVVGDEVVGQLVRVQAGLFLDTAQKEKLDRLIFDRYQLRRKDASPAVGQVEFSNPTPTVGSFNIPAGTRLKASDGKAFVTTAAVIFPAAVTGPIPVPVQSTLSGLSTQAKPGTIVTIVDLPAGAPGTLRVTNSMATAGASNEESDDAYRDRGKKYYTTARRGTLKAIERGALDVPGVRTAVAFETLEIDGTPARIVEVVVADEFTQQLVNAESPPVTYDTQAQQLALNVQAGLQDVRAAGIMVSVTVANVVLLGVTLALRFRAGVDANAAATQARTEIVNYTNSLRPGQTWDRLTANERLRRVPGLVVSGGGAEIFSPSGDVVPMALQVLRTSLDLVIVGS